MRDIDSDIQAAINKKTLIARNLIGIDARDRDTGDIVTGYFWNDIGTVAIDVINPIGGGTDSHDFVGAGSLLKIDDIPLTSTIAVRSVNASLSGINDDVVSLVRGYDLKGQKVVIWRAVLDVDTRALVAPAPCRFLGFVDGVNITTPAEGQEGAITLALVSHTRETTRASADKSSDESQKLRSSTDNFFVDAGVVGNWTMFWGMKKGKIGGTSSSTADNGGTSASFITKILR